MTSKNSIPDNPALFAMKASEGAWKPYKHLNLIIELLMYVVQGRLTRLMVFCPPRHGKSELISYYFLTWYLGMFPDKRVILTTHTATFSRKWGRRCRNLLKKIGTDLFPTPVELSEDSQSASAWNIKNHKGGLFTAGTGGAILGEGANLFLIDDPTKGFKKARSKTHQQELNDWWFTEAKTRLDADLNNGIKPCVVGIWQRLNKHDLAGQILEQEPQMPIHEAIQILRNGGNIPYGTWVICNLPAIAEQNDPLGRNVGEALWSEKLPIEDLQSIKREMGSFRFQSLYQGDPQDPEGDIFKRVWFENSKIQKKDIPSNMPKLRYWDLGASGEEGDATSGILSGYHDDILYFIELVHGHFTASRVLSEFKNTLNRDGRSVTIRIEQEPGAGSKILIKKLRNENKKHMIRADKVTKDKLTRSFDLAALAEDGKVRIVDNIFDKVVNELVNFDGEEGGEDNIVDTCTGSANYWLRPRRKVNIT